MQRFISRHGFPVVLKEAIGENPSPKIDKISSDQELLSAISRMKRRSEDHLSPARSLVTSAYAENSLNVHEDEQGHRVAAPGARLLVEKHVSGRYIRCLVCGGRFLAAIEKTAATPEETWMLVERLHDDFKDVALRATMEIPGLAVASVDLVVGDPTLCREGQAYFVVELCERPRLESYLIASPALAPSLADRFLCHQAEQSSVRLQTPADVVATFMRAESLTEPQLLLPVLRDTCNALGIVGFARPGDQTSGIVEGHLQGKPSTIARVIEALMSGTHFGQRAMAIEAAQTPLESYADFTVA
ncbi:MAG TPA: hypothetical protein VM163_00585 [bacterium]|nr:hypothetical protein [bacterium]